MNASSLIEQLNAATFDERVNGAIEVEGFDSGAISETRQWVNSLRDKVVHDLQSTDEEEEHRSIAASYFIDFKTQWMGLNTKMNYAMFRTGQPDQPSMLRGSGISVLIDVVEQHADPEDVDTIVTFISDRVDRAKAA
ncbi:MAG: hypothetical protein AAGI30_00905 [Planctomycetota bacterium]